MANEVTDKNEVTISRDINKIENKKDYKLEVNKLVDLLGGKDNIIETEAEMSRFKVTLKDISKANKEGILKLGAKGVVEIDDQLKIIIGNQAKQLKKYI